MKKSFLFYMFVFFTIIGLFSESLPRKFYFPECQVQIPAPQGWYARNETQANVGMVFISKEEIIGREGKFLTGLSFYSNYEKIMKKEVPDTNYFAEALFPETLKLFPKKVKKNYYELETKLGKFKFMEIIEGRKPVVAYGVLKSDKGAFKVTIEAPVDEWESTRPILLEMVKNIRLLSSGRENDEIVYSVFDHPLSKLYDQRDYRKKKDLIEKFNRLKKGMGVREYFDIMDYKLREVKSEEGDKKKLANETPGWINNIPLATAPNKFDSIDIYGVYNGCICEELFYVRIENNEITDLNLINRVLPGDFNVEEWESFLAGPVINPEQVKMKFEKINAWKTEKDRAIKAFEKIKNIHTGISEMEYLNMAQSFNIHFMLYILQVIPGLFDIQGTNLPDQGIKREYVYAFSEDGKIVPLGKVIVLDGKVTAITPVPQEELEEPTLTCAPRVVRPGEFIMVDFTAPAHYPANAWVGIIPAQVPHGLETINDRYDLSYQYLNKRTRGTLFFTAPREPGNYDFRMNDSDAGGNEVRSVSFTVRSQETKIAGTIDDGYYVSPDKSFKVKMPVVIGMGGEVEDRTVPHELGYKAFIVGFTDDFGYMYMVVTFKVDNDKDTVDYCQQENIKARNDSNYVGEELVETERGKETWIKKFIKGGSHMVSRNLTAKTEDERKPKKSDLSVTTTCFRIGNRIFNVMAAVSTNPLNKTYDQTELVESSKRKLKKFLDSFEVIDGPIKVTARKVSPQKSIENKIPLPENQQPRLIKGPNPKYPKEALESQIQGNVTIEAATDIYGQVVSAKAIEGPEILRPAAVEAIKKWQYEPYILNGVPRPVKFTVVVKFSLDYKKKIQ